MCVCTHRGWAHRERVSTTFLTRKNSQILLVLLTGFEPRSFGPLDFESDALPVEPPSHHRHIFHLNLSCHLFCLCLLLLRCFEPSRSEVNWRGPSPLHQLTFLHLAQEIPYYIIIVTLPPAMSHMDTFCDFECFAVWFLALIDVSLK